jgi:uncharacterized membrane protein YbhN (UPF0104 family)
VVFKNLKLRKSLLWSVKILVFLFAVYIFIQQFSKISAQDCYDISISNLSYIFLAIILVFFNWGLELLKWYFTVKPIDKKVGISKLIQSLLAGISTGFITPNRLGNFVGRMLYYEGKSKYYLILGTLYGNFAQFLASLFFGLVGFYFVGSRVFSLDEQINFSYLVFSIGGISLLVYALYPILPSENIGWLKKRFNILATFRSIAKRIALPLILISHLRYLVFVLQYSLLLIAFGAEYSHDLIYALYLHYLIVTLTPTLFLGKIVVREAVGLFVLSAFISNSSIIILSSLLLWIINLGIPALAGLYFLLKVKTQEE